MLILELNGGLSSKNFSLMRNFMAVYAQERSFFGHLENKYQKVTYFQSCTKFANFLDSVKKNLLHKIFS